MAGFGEARGFFWEPLRAFYFALFDGRIYTMALAADAREGEEQRLFAAR